MGEEDWGWLIIGGGGGGGGKAVVVDMCQIYTDMHTEVCSIRKGAPHMGERKGNAKSQVSVDLVLLCFALKETKVSKKTKWTRGLYY